jgi:hypothetical protein
MQFRNKNLLAAVFLANLVAQTVTAQNNYNVHSWFSFEEGKFTDKLTFGHTTNPNKIRVVPYSEVGLPAEISANGAAKEIAGHGVAFFADHNSKDQMSIISTTAMDRTRLGPTGRALYQGDFWVPAEGEPMPTQALLAVVPKEGNQFSFNFYRFGLLDSGTHIFFAYTGGQPAPVIYQSQPLSEFNLKRPGWHRFQIIFEGSDRIICAIDGQQTSFSPIIEPTLTKLHPGIMVTATKGSGTMIADNLSIQWTMEDVPLPDSPWEALRNGESPTIANAGTSTPAVSGAGNAEAASLYDSDSLTWYKDPTDAWRSAVDKPTLVLFYAPRIEPYRYLKSITPNTPEVEALFQKFSLARVDANQLSGGKIAQDRKIARLPTLFVIDAAGREKGRIPILSNETKWEDIERDLKAFLQ